MAVTVESFLVRYPEFNSAGKGLIQAAIDEAKLQINASVWGAKEDAGTQALAAHTLAISPFGVNAKLVSEKGSSVYEKRFRQLLRQVTYGFRVV